ncbi:MAG: type I glyceraldehyde-3-phosphate dehydrogenase [Candidatus Eremiobacter antarcticus]|nr:type I glyceraldehyde-3-phosphate dehydrogenase [Candidatus Eremiobacteraeota bacterium]PZR60916.1 MAG: type I glyceraldehyde-3-phosphate dehydrogenase [Candidatus Eremiobacter sp. RRmetagenome_bin22]
MSTRVAINGFGRIGRQALRAINERHMHLDVVALNDLMDTKTAAHLFKHDSTYGNYPGSVSAGDGVLTIDGKTIKLLAERSPANLPWKELEIDLVLESTGLFTDATKAKAHLDAGAGRVIISAPAKNEDVTIVLGVNEDTYDPAKHKIISNASCTTNCLAPVVKVLVDELGVLKGTMTTVHSYTNDQRTLDLPHEDLRRARAAGLNIIPTTTGAAKALHLVVPEVKGKMDGISLRVPTPTVSIVDVVAETQKPTTKEALNDLFRRYARDRMKDILGVSDEPLVSMDYKGDSRSSVVDALSTTVVADNLVKVLSWYDNEWGYACRLADLAAFVLQKEAQWATPV